MPKTKRNYAEPPPCYKMEVIYDRTSDVCKLCPFFLPCGVSVGEEFDGMDRKEFEMSMAENRVPFRDAVDAIVENYDSVSVNAAELSYTRKIKKVGL